MAVDDDEGEQTSMAGLAAQILRGLIRDLPDGYEAVVQDGALVIREAQPAVAETAPWRDRDEAMAHAIQLGAQFGRPIVTGIMVYLPDGEDKPFVIGVTTHSMEDGDGLVLVRCKADMPLVRQEVQRIQALNAEAMRRYDETMHQNTAKMQLHARRSEIAKRGWAHRREREREREQPVLRAVVSYACDHDDHEHCNALASGCMCSCHAPQPPAESDGERE